MTKISGYYLLLSTITLVYIIYNIIFYIANVSPVSINYSIITPVTSESSYHFHKNILGFQQRTFVCGKNVESKLCDIHFDNQYNYTTLYKLTLDMLKWHNQSNNGIFIKLDDDVLVSEYYIKKTIEPLQTKSGNYYGGIDVNCHNGLKCAHGMFYFMSSNVVECASVQLENLMKETLLNPNAGNLDLNEDCLLCTTIYTKCSHLDIQHISVTRSNIIHKSYNDDKVTIKLNLHPNH